MPATRAQVESALVRRYGAKFTTVGLDGITINGTNGDLAGPIGVGLASLGIEPADPFSPADSDLATVRAADVPQLLDVAGLACLETVLANWVEPDQMADTDNQQWLGKFYDSTEATAKRLRAQVERQYGIGRGKLSAGSLDLGFAETMPWHRDWEF